VTVTCTYHCGSCGTHFHSLNAFDAHRQGDHATNDPETGRHCVHPWDLLDKKGNAVLVSLTEEGICRIYEEKAGQTIWTIAKDLVRARERYGRTEAARSSEDPREVSF
jgi:hypothetical protein